MGLNTVRLEGKLESKSFSIWQMKEDPADRGLVLLRSLGAWPTFSAGLCHRGTVAAPDVPLRGHASLVARLNGSDNPPPPDVSKRTKGEKELLANRLSPRRRRNLRAIPARAA
jgi:hypothetical protein